MNLDSIVGTRTLLSAVAIFLSTAPDYAAISFDFSDAEAVRRAEIIAIAVVKEGSVHLIEPPGRLPEHHFELEVSEFLKGTNVSRSITVCAPWGLTPIIGGYSSNRIQVLNKRDMSVWLYKTNYPPHAIEMWETFNGNGDSFTGDLRTNHIWLLWHDPSYQFTCKSNLISVYKPANIQPTQKREKLKEYLQ